MSGIPPPATPAPAYSERPDVNVNANANPDDISHAPPTAMRGGNEVPYGPDSIGEVPHPHQQYDGISAPPLQEKQGLNHSYDETSPQPRGNQHPSQPYNGASPPPQVNQYPNQPYNGTSPPPQGHPYPNQPPQDNKQYPNQPHPVYPPHPQPHPQHQPTGFAMATPLASVQSAPCPVDCARCGQCRLSRVEAHSGGTVHAWAAFACCCFCLPCIPYFVRALKDVEHYCGNPGCNDKLAIWHNSGRVEVLQYARK